MVKAQKETRTFGASEFVPFACHYDGASVLTKDGELCKTLRIQGFSYDAWDGSRKRSLRDDLRKVLLEHAFSPDVAIYVHIIRRKSSLSLAPQNEGCYFSSQLEKSWKNSQNLESGYANDLYITLVHEGSVFNLFDFVQFSRSIFFRPEKYYQAQRVAKAHAKLCKIFESITHELSAYHPHILGVQEANGVVCSEILSFFNHLLNLVPAQEIPLPVADLSLYLTPFSLRMHHNYLEVSLPQENKRYASVLTPKQYRELKPAAVDVFLQCPAELIITHQILPGTDKEYVKKAEYKKYIATLGEDEEFIKLSGLSDILEQNRGNTFDYAQQQTTIMVMGNTLGQLENGLHELTERLQKVGMVALREDVMMEEVFYSQLPGNFEFIRRKEPIGAAHIAGYSTLYDFSAGKIIGNIWPSAISVLPSREGNPYFFSFHNAERGHTLITGPFGSGKTLLTNFLLAQAMRVNPRVFVFDNHRTSEILLRSNHHLYHRFSRDKSVECLKLNPLQLADTPENREFLVKWLHSLTFSIDGEPVEGLELKHWELVVAQIFTWPKEQRKLSECVRLIAEFPRSAQDFFSQWVGEGRYGHIFDNVEDQWQEQHLVQGFDVTEMVQDKRPHWAVFSYLLHRVLHSLDGHPTIVLLNEAWVLLDNSIFRPTLDSVLKRMQQRNALAIFINENLMDVAQSELTPIVTSNLATTILMQDTQSTKAYCSVFGLTEHEYALFQSLDRERRQFFVKQGYETVILELPLPNDRTIMEVLSAKQTTVTRMENVISQVGKDPATWVPLLCS